MKFNLLGSLALIAPTALWASDDVRGEATTFDSPNGLTERCIRIEKVLAGQELLKVGRSNPGPLIGKELCAAGEGVHKVEQHGK